MENKTQTPLTLREKVYITALIAASNLFIGLMLWQWINPQK